MRRRGFLAIVPAALSVSGCGYHVGGRADLLPKSIRTIAVPAFVNATPRYKLSERLTAAVAREFITRTRYRVIADPGQADAVLNGAVLSYVAYPTIFDPATGRASGVQVLVVLSLNLQERATGKALYSRPAMELRERYEVSVDQVAYFEESDTALERLSRDVARTVVSSILEAF